ncbi:uncharacterized protein LOC128261906 [Drosophila gunungcola]|uniref:uncharacterized protein LOC128261906 n=1 Tax=Drosophila gunungcola TaxID=103775 RepID=UPI0022E1DCF8|nr:uncharacterized protein LOC128261906 [Drosophila gunungcola]XP_052851804.1 uncharacterized protein LOC128261906 [Drosophila gunungcola]XP_052851805.1 uncharacterized protein LOC128261906 [Drosophila gunungcola]XP_052851806.1 uncharacterized protein LOC128261906 [Drosophila gunungcola]
MLTRQPDYTISELGHPIHQWPDSTLCESLKKLDNRKVPSSPPSPHRLLPLRETLDDYLKRLTLRSREDFEEDPIYQQKQRKNQWNEQQRKRNQKSRDKDESRATATTTTIATTSDLNNF